ncbi:MAG: hypothetical protein EPO21_12965 [Chloroflexota bacterium]|nr:MAG: hypothetical protein EPO21_12965 [Chloroflexota bacterium]
MFTDQDREEIRAIIRDELEVIREENRIASDRFIQAERERLAELNRERAEQGLPPIPPMGL